MPRPVLLFSGPWADLPLDALAAKAAGWKYDGLELCCWGDHLEVQRGLSDDGYCPARLDLLARPAAGGDRRRAQAVREAVAPDPRRGPGVRRAVRLRGAPGATGVRPVLGGADPRRARRPGGVRVHVRPEPPALAGRGPGRVL